MGEVKGAMERNGTWRGGFGEDDKAKGRGVGGGVGGIGGVRNGYDRKTKMGRREEKQLVGEGKWKRRGS